ncbi:MAG: response regulator [Candidatus Omnitrophica bacterium]|nr:response regulator [Candidatus Omnitrophota bacterium]
MVFKLLVVDDEKEVTATLSEFFLDQGFMVEQAASGNEAIEKLGANEFELVLLDLHMPGIPGEEVLRHIKSTAPQTKVVVVTGYPERKTAVCALGCDGFFTKPLALGELIDAVKILLKEKNEEDLKQVIMGRTLANAETGQPLARLLLFEPSDEIAHTLLEYFRNPRKCGGAYTIERATNVEQAVILLETLHPELALLDLVMVSDPADVTKRLLGCAKHQPKDYLCYLCSTEEAKGKPVSPEELRKLNELVQKTALAHGLVAG